MNKMKRSIYPVIRAAVYQGFGLPSIFPLIVALMWTGHLLQEQ
jgi:hypothetical protein